jgi:hypothetical protein
MAFLSAFGQDKRDPQAWTIFDVQPRSVVEFEVTSMSPGDSDDQRQAKSRAGLISAILEPHEAFDHARAVGFSDTGAGVGDRELDIAR